jgi:hypothetical protein
MKRQYLSERKGWQYCDFLVFSKKVHLLRGLTRGLEASQTLNRKYIVYLMIDGFARCAH